MIMSIMRYVDHDDHVVDHDVNHEVFTGWIMMIMLNRNDYVVDYNLKEIFFD